jgi:hypothetical protein
VLNENKENPVRKSFLNPIESKSHREDGNLPQGYQTDMMSKGLQCDAPSYIPVTASRVEKEI